MTTGSHRAYCCLTRLPVPSPQTASQVLLLYLTLFPSFSFVRFLPSLLPFFFNDSSITNNSIFSFYYSNLSFSVSSPFVLQAVSVGFVVLVPMFRYSIHFDIGLVLFMARVMGPNSFFCVWIVSCPKSIC